MELVIYLEEAGPDNHKDYLILYIQEVKFPTIFKQMLR